MKLNANIFSLDSVERTGTWIMRSIDHLKRDLNSSMNYKPCLLDTVRTSFLLLFTLSVAFLFIWTLLIKLFDQIQGHVK